jgi:hypothetical protein
LYKQNEVAGDIIGISTQNGLRYLEIVSEDDVRATAYGGTKLKISTNNGIKAIGIYK